MTRRERVAAIGHWLLEELDVRTLHFYGGLALIGFAESRQLIIVGGILVAHAALSPIVTPLLARTGGHP